MIKPSMSISGVLPTEERYTYGQNLQYGGIYKYGGPGSLVLAEPYSSVKPGVDDKYKKITFGAIITYDESGVTYDDSLYRYDGATAKQDIEPQLSVIDL